MIFLIILISVIAVCITIFSIYLLKRRLQKKYEKFVLDNSDCLKRLNEINSRYEFYPHVDYDQSHTYDNEKIYDTVSCRDYIIYQLQYSQKQIRDQINKVNANKQMYSQYLDEIKTVTQSGQFIAPPGKLKLDKLLRYEKLLIKKQTFAAPCTHFYLTVYLYCSKINGQIYRSKNEAFYADDITALIKRLNNKRGTYYADRNIWEAICRVERGKISNKMRFAIYERDGYRCRRCGVRDGYARLEIDHIIPIAKGGKSTYDNLQTLCHDCNVEKGDSLY